MQQKTGRKGGRKMGHQSWQGRSRPLTFSAPAAVHASRPPRVMLRATRPGGAAAARARAVASLGGEPSAASAPPATAVPVGIPVPVPVEVSGEGSTSSTGCREASCVRSVERICTYTVGGLSGQQQARMVQVGSAWVRSGGWEVGRAEGPAHTRPSSCNRETSAPANTRPSPHRQEIAPLARGQKPRPPRTARSARQAAGKTKQRRRQQRAPVAAAHTLR